MTITIPDWVFWPQGYILSFSCVVAYHLGIWQGRRKERKDRDK